MNSTFAARLLWLTRSLRARERWSRAQLAAHQDRALRALRDYAFACSPFYRSFHRGLSGAPLDALPVLTKAQLMERFDDVVTDPLVRLRDVERFVAGLPPDAADAPRFRDHYWLNATSGSTGRRGVFLFDTGEWLAVLASFARMHEWAGFRVNLHHRMRLASVASVSPWHMSASVASTLRSWWLPSLRLSAADPLPDIVRRLNDWRPEILVAYASMLRLLAEERRAGRLRIAPRVVFSSSEVLTADTRRHVERAWGKRLFDEYGTTEAGGLAAECRAHRGLHIAEDLYIVEVVDGENRPVPPGEFGAKVLLTVLSSRTLPLIRYELSDSVRLSDDAGPCPCGRPFRLIDGIQGRVEDVLRFVAPRAPGGAVVVHPHVFHRIMDRVPAAGWQVVQERGGLRVRLAGLRDGFDDSALLEVFRRELAHQGLPDLPIFLVRVSSIPRTANGKAPLVVPLKERLAPAAPVVAQPGQAVPVWAAVAQRRDVPRAS